MKIIHWLPIFCLIPCAFAQQAPWGRTDLPISAYDRVYAADQTSNTVSVIDPSSNRLLGVIRLGDPVPGALSPLYKGELLVHGLRYSPDSKTLAVVSVASNSVTLIETAEDDFNLRAVGILGPTKRSSQQTDANCGSPSEGKTMSQSSIQRR